jgi:hypothetical protein
MQALSDLLVSTNLGTFVNHYDWVWPLFEMLHFVGMALLIGTVGLVDLRVLGVGKGIPISELERLIPWGIAGFVVNALTGFVFIAGNPVGGPMEYLMNLSLGIKMLLILLAGINLLIFYFTGIARATEAVPADGDAPQSAKVIAGVSLVLWFGVIFFGRLIMYNDTLLYAFGL